MCVKSNRRDSNFQIEEAFKKIGDEDINFLSVFPSNYMDKFVNHKMMISEKNGKYPFLIGNTDSSSKQNTHWWSILDTEPKIDILIP